MICTCKREMAAKVIKEQLPEFFIEGDPTEEILGRGGYGYVKKVGI